MTETPDIYVDLVSSQGWALFLADIVRPKIVELRRSCLDNDHLSEKEHFANVRQLRSLREIVMNAYLNAGYDSSALPDKFGKLFT